MTGVHVFLILWWLCLVALPLYVIYVSLVLRRSWRRSKLSAMALASGIPALLVILYLPTLYAY